MISIVTDLRQCRRLWEQFVPDTGLFSLWDVRACFQKHYRYTPRFVLSSDSHGPRGLLPLSEIDEHDYWGFFPGETYKGKTWLEQNPLIAETPAEAEAMLDACSAPTQLRYMTAGPIMAALDAPVDETGYLFRPGDYGYDFDRYRQEFSGKSRKKLQREIDVFAEQGVAFRHDDPADAELAFQLNLTAFGESSYFADARFLASFRNLVDYLAERALLRITAVSVGGRPAAVDVGAVYRGVYTVLAGGTDPDFLGIAKLINLHHIEWACRQRLSLVDFLCGDFGWKQRFHLSPRSLYALTRGEVPAISVTDESVVYVA